MKIVKFKGGLGNQLFQYSFLRALQLKYNFEDVKADLSYYNDIKNDSIRIPRIEKLRVKMVQASRVELSKVCVLNHITNPMSLNYKAKIFLEKTLNKKYYFEMDRRYRNPEDILQYQYFDGYWQSWNYMSGIEKCIRNEIIPNEKISRNTQNTIEKISGENAVFIGIRRGDYLSTTKSRKHFGSFGNEYYNKAIQIIKEKINNPVFYIFSNDIEWVKDNMMFDCKPIYRDDKDQSSDIEELFIMASCKHAIIVNSTFYWWGAWLIENENKIIVAPQQWFSDGSPIDIVPDTWLKI